MEKGKTEVLEQEETFYIMEKGRRTLSRGDSQGHTVVEVGEMGRVQDVPNYLVSFLCEEKSLEILNKEEVILPSCF